MSVKPTVELAESGARGSRLCVIEPLSTWKVACKDYLVRCELNLEESTVTSYRYHLRKLLEWTDMREIPLEEFTAKDMREYLLDRTKGLHSATNGKINGTPCGKKTLREDAICAMCFFRFCALRENKYLTINPLEDYEIPRAPENQPPMPEAEDLTELLQAVERYYNPKENPDIAAMKTPKRKFHLCRNRAILCALISSAARIGEVLNLRLEDYDPNHRDKEGNPSPEIYIAESKNDEDRYVPIDHIAVEAIEDWLRIRPKSPTKFLFLSEVAETGALTPNAFGARFRKIKKFAGITKPYTRHGIRHYGITVCAEVSLVGAGGIAGHKDLRVTKKYIHKNADHLRKTHTEAAPLLRVMVTKRAAANRRKRVDYKK